MSTSKISYDVLQVDGLKDVLTEVSHTCSGIGINFFIVGAIARNIWYALNNELPSGTKDVDIAIQIPDINDYNRLKKELQTKYGYVESNENVFCMISPKGIQLDLLPFGQIGQEDIDMIAGESLAQINLDGFEEVYELGKYEINIGNEKYTACTIPAVVILKLIAFDDRPERRIKDVQDINNICAYYPDLETEHIWENHSDLYDGEIEHNEVAMMVLGREMKKITAKNQRLIQRIQTILENALAGKSDIAKYMVQDVYKENIDQKMKQLSDVLKGFIQ